MNGRLQPSFLSQPAERSEPEAFIDAQELWALPRGRAPDPDPANLEGGVDLTPNPALTIALSPAPT